MSYKTLIVHVENSPESDLRLRVAVDLAYDLSASLIGVGGRAPPYVEDACGGGAYSVYAAGALTEVVLAQESMDLQKARASFERIAGPLASAVWRSGDDYPDRVMQGCMAGADLVVASASRGPHASTVDPGAVLLTAGLPVLIIPTDLMGLRRKSIVIAWKNTREARRAVTDAMQLLRGAERVTVVQVKGESEAADVWNGVQSVVGRLARHGVNAIAEQAPRGSSDDATDLIAFAEDNLADLIVSGAYGHSRLREWSFGGVTKGLLSRSSLPVLFSH